MNGSLYHPNQVPSLLSRRDLASLFSQHGVSAEWRRANRGAVPHVEDSMGQTRQIGHLVEIHDRFSLMEQDRRTIRYNLSAWEGMPDPLYSFTTQYRHGIDPAGDAHTYRGVPVQIHRSSQKRRLDRDLTRSFQGDVRLERADLHGEQKDILVIDEGKQVNPQELEAVLSRYGTSLDVSAGYESLHQMTPDGMTRQQIDQLYTNFGYETKWIDTRAGTIPALHLEGQGWKAVAYPGDDDEQYKMIAWDGIPEPLAEWIQHEGGIPAKKPSRRSEPKIGPVHSGAGEQMVGMGLTLGLIYHTLTRSPSRSGAFISGHPEGLSVDSVHEAASSSPDPAPVVANRRTGVGATSKLERRTGGFSTVTKKDAPATQVTRTLTPQIADEAVKQEVYPEGPDSVFERVAQQIDQISGKRSGSFAKPPKTALGRKIWSQINRRFAEEMDIHEIPGDISAMTDQQLVEYGDQVIRILKETRQDVIQSTTADMRGFRERFLQMARELEAGDRTLEGTVGDVTAALRQANIMWNIEDFPHTILEQDRQTPEELARWIRSQAYELTRTSGYKELRSMQTSFYDLEDRFGEFFIDTRVTGTGSRQATVNRLRPAALDMSAVDEDHMNLLGATEFDIDQLQQDIQRPPASADHQQRFVHLTHDRFVMPEDGYTQRRLTQTISDVVSVSKVKDRTRVLRRLRRMREHVGEGLAAAYTADQAQQQHRALIDLLGREIVPQDLTTQREFVVVIDDLLDQAAGETADDSLVQQLLKIKQDILQTPEDDFTLDTAKTYLDEVTTMAGRSVVKGQPRTKQQILQTIDGLAFRLERAVTPEESRQLLDLQKELLSAPQPLETEDIQDRLRYVLTPEERRDLDQETVTSVLDRAREKHHAYVSIEETPGTTMVQKLTPEFRETQAALRQDRARRLAMREMTRTRSERGIQAPPTQWLRFSHDWGAYDAVPVFGKRGHAEALVHDWDASIEETLVSLDQELHRIQELPREGLLPPRSADVIMQKMEVLSGIQERLWAVERDDAYTPESVGSIVEYLDTVMDEGDLVDLDLPQIQQIRKTLTPFLDETVAGYDAGRYLFMRPEGPVTLQDERIDYFRWVMEQEGEVYLPKTRLPYRLESLDLEEGTATVVPQTIKPSAIRIRQKISPTTVSAGLSVPVPEAPEIPDVVMGYLSGTSAVPVQIGDQIRPVSKNVFLEAVNQYQLDLQDLYKDIIPYQGQKVPITVPQQLFDVVARHAPWALDTEDPTDLEDVASNIVTAFYEHMQDPYARAPRVTEEGKILFDEQKIMQRFLGYQLGREADIGLASRERSAHVAAREMIQLHVAQHGAQPQSADELMTQIAHVQRGAQRLAEKGRDLGGFADYSPYRLGHLRSFLDMPKTEQQRILKEELVGYSQQPIYLDPMLMQDTMSMTPGSYFDIRREVIEGTPEGYLPSMDPEATTAQQRQAAEQKAAFVNQLGEQEVLDERVFGTPVEQVEMPRLVQELEGRLGRLTGEKRKQAIRRTVNVLSEEMRVPRGEAMQLLSQHLGTKTLADAYTQDELLRIGLGGLRNWEPTAEGLADLTQVMESFNMDSVDIDVYVDDVPYPGVLERMRDGSGYRVVSTASQAGTRGIEGMTSSAPVTVPLDVLDASYVSFPLKRDFEVSSKVAGIAEDQAVPFVADLGWDVDDLVRRAPTVTQPIGIDPGVTQQNVQAFLEGQPGLVLDVETTDLIDGEHFAVTEIAYRPVQYVEQQAMEQGTSVTRRMLERGDAVHHRVQMPPQVRSAIEEIAQAETVSPDQRQILANIAKFDDITWGGLSKEDLAALEPDDLLRLQRSATDALPLFTAERGAISQTEAVQRYISDSQGRIVVAQNVGFDIPAQRLLADTAMAEQIARRQQTFVDQENLVFSHLASRIPEGDYTEQVLSDVTTDLVHMRRQGFLTDETAETFGLDAVDAVFDEVEDITQRLQARNIGALGSRQKAALIDVANITSPRWSRSLDLDLLDEAGLVELRKDVLSSIDRYRAGEDLPGLHHLLPDEGTGIEGFIDQFRTIDEETIWGQIDEPVRQQVRPLLDELHAEGVSPQAVRQYQRKLQELELPQDISRRLSIQTPEQIQDLVLEDAPLIELEQVARPFVTRGSRSLEAQVAARFGTDSDVYRRYIESPHLALTDIDAEIDLLESYLTDIERAPVETIEPGQHLLITQSPEGGAIQRGVYRINAIGHTQAGYGADITPILGGDRLTLGGATHMDLQYQLSRYGHVIGQEDVDLMQEVWGQEIQTPEDAARRYQDLLRDEDTSRALDRASRSASSMREYYRRMVDRPDAERTLQSPDELREFVQDFTQSRRASPRMVQQAKQILAGEMAPDIPDIKLAAQAVEIMDRLNVLEGIDDIVDLPAASAVFDAQQRETLVDTFRQVSGVGDTLAENIGDYAMQTGGLHSLDELIRVQGIGPKRLQQIQQYLAEHPEIQIPLQEPVLQPLSLQGGFDLQAATVDDWMTIPGIGKGLSQKIVDYQEQHGIESLDDLLNVPGIGAGRLEQIQQNIPSAAPPDVSPQEWPLSTVRFTQDGQLIDPEQVPITRGTMGVARERLQSKVQGILSSQEQPSALTDEVIADASRYNQLAGEYGLDLVDEDLLTQYQQQTGRDVSQLAAPGGAAGVREKAEQIALRSKMESLTPGERLVLANAGMLTDDRLEQSLRGAMMERPGRQLEWNPQLAEILTGPEYEARYPFLKHVETMQASGMLTATEAQELTHAFNERVSDMAPTKVLPHLRTAGELSADVTMPFAGPVQVDVTSVETAVRSLKRQERTMVRELQELPAYANVSRQRLVEQVDEAILDSLHVSGSVDQAETFEEAASQIVQRKTDFDLLPMAEVADTSHGLFADLSEAETAQRVQEIQKTGQRVLREHFAGDEAQYFGGVELQPVEMAGQGQAFEIPTMGRGIPEGQPIEFYAGDAVIPQEHVRFDRERRVVRFTDDVDVSEGVHANLYEQVPIRERSKDPIVRQAVRDIRQAREELGDPAHVRYYTYTGRTPLLHSSLAGEMLPIYDEELMTEMLTSPDSMMEPTAMRQAVDVLTLDMDLLRQERQLLNNRGVRGDAVQSINELIDEDSLMRRKLLNRMERLANPYVSESDAVASDAVVHQARQALGWTQDAPLEETLITRGRMAGRTLGQALSPDLSEKQLRENMRLLQHNIDTTWDKHSRLPIMRDRAKAYLNMIQEQTPASTPSVDAGAGQTGAGVQQAVRNINEQTKRRGATRRIDTTRDAVRKINQSIVERGARKKRDSIKGSLGQKLRDKLTGGGFGAIPLVGGLALGAFALRQMTRRDIAVSDRSRAQDQGYLEPPPHIEQETVARTNPPGLKVRASARSRHPEDSDRFNQLISDSIENALQVPVNIHVKHEDDRQSLTSDWVDQVVSQLLVN